MVRRFVQVVSEKLRTHCLQHTSGEDLNSVFLYFVKCAVEKCYHESKHRPGFPDIISMEDTPQNIFLYPQKPLLIKIFTCKISKMQSVARGHLSDKDSRDISRDIWQFSSYFKIFVYLLQDFLWYPL